MGALASLFGGGKKDEPPAPQPAPAPETRPEGESTSRKIVRAALIGTSSMAGDLSPVNTGRRKLLGN